MQAFRPIPSGGLKKKDSTLALSRRVEGLWILPTISRPQNLKRLIQSYRDVGEEAPVFVFLWTGDPKFPEVLNQEWPLEWTIIQEKERFTAGEAMRRIIKYAPKAAFYGFLADDIVFKTQWSAQLASAAAPCFISYPDDLVQGERLCTHFTCGGELVRRLGWWALPELQHSGIDLAFMNLGYNVPGLLKYRPDVIFEHMHPMVHKGAQDEIYDHAKSLMPEDNKIYQRWLRGDLTTDIDKVRGLLYGQAAERE